MRTYAWYLTSMVLHIFTLAIALSSDSEKSMAKITATRSAWKPPPRTSGAPKISFNERSTNAASSERFGF